jgi:hypothetical protein
MYEAYATIHLTIILFPKMNMHDEFRVDSYQYDMTDAESK